MKHPWNQDIGKGNMSEKMGYACIGFFSTGDNIAVFFDNNHEHGMCELYSKKTENK